MDASTVVLLIVLWLLLTALAVVAGYRVGMDRAPVYVPVPCDLGGNPPAQTELPQ